MGPSPSRQTCPCPPPPGGLWTDCSLRWRRPVPLQLSPSPPLSVCPAFCSSGRRCSGTSPSLPPFPPQSWHSPQGPPPGPLLSARAWGSASRLHLPDWEAKNWVLLPNLLNPTSYRWPLQVSATVIPTPTLGLILTQESGTVTGLPATSACTWGLGRHTATCLRRPSWRLAGSGGPWPSNRRPPQTPHRRRLLQAFQSQSPGPPGSGRCRSGRGEGSPGKPPPTTALFRSPLPPFPASALQAAISLGE